MTPFQQKLKNNYMQKDFREEYLDMLMDESGSVIMDGLEMKIILNERHNNDQNVVFTYNGKYYKVVGSYDSYEGTEFYDPTNVLEVMPIQKMVIDYVPTTQE